MTAQFVADSFASSPRLWWCSVLLGALSVWWWCSLQCVMYQCFFFLYNVAVLLPFIFKKMLIRFRDISTYVGLFGCWPQPYLWRQKLTKHTSCKVWLSRSTDQPNSCISFYGVATSMVWLIMTNNQTTSIYFVHNRWSSSLPNSE